MLKKVLLINYDSISSTNLIVYLFKKILRTKRETIRITVKKRIKVMDFVVNKYHSNCQAF